MKSEIMLSKLFPLRLLMPKISFNFFSKIFSPKLLFVFCFVLVFSFSQVNFSGAQAAQDCKNLFSIDTIKDGECKKEDGTLYKIVIPCSNSFAKSPANPVCYNVRKVSEPTTNSIASSTAANAEVAKKANENEGGSFCAKISTLNDSAKKIGCYVIYSIMEVFLQTFAVFVKISSYIFDTAMQKYVLQISTLFKDGSGVDKAYIYKAWSVIRDLANIAAFFGAVYTGFRYITGSDSLDFKKAVTKLILYSILVNFSFPIAKFLIDISNVISLQIYGGITNYTIGNNTLSDSILRKMGAVSLLVSDVGAVKTVFPGFSSFSVMFLAIVYLFCIFFVFIYAAIIIIVRSLILLICVILSPLMFLNFAFPRLTELHEKWRENFFGQLVFAPILMFGLWISFVLLEAATTGLDAASSVFAGAAPNLSNASDMELNKIIAMTIAIITLFLAVKMSSSVAGGAGKSISGMVGGGMKGLGLAVATGGTSLLARATVGRAGAMMANSNWVKNTGAENGASRRMAASLASNTGNKMSNFSVAGVKSFNEKKLGNLKSDRDKMNAENGQQIRKTGMSDLIAQAKNPEELKLAKEEMIKRADPNYKRNEDVFGNQAKQKAFELDQALRKDMRINNVSGGNRAQFRKLAENKVRLESPEVIKLRAERINKVEEGRISQVSNVKEKYDNLLNSAKRFNLPSAEIEKITAERDQEIRNSEEKLRVSRGKGVDFSAGQRALEVSDRINKLRNTSVVGVAAKDVGSLAGDVHNAVTDNVLTRGVGKVVDLATAPIKKVGEVLDRPGVVESITRNLAEGFRSKKLFTLQSPAKGSNTIEPVVKLVKTKSRVEGAVQKSDREAVK